MKKQAGWPVLMIGAQHVAHAADTDVHADAEWFHLASCAQWVGLPRGQRPGLPPFSLFTLHSSNFFPMFTGRSTNDSFNSIRGRFQLRER